MARLWNGSKFSLHCTLLDVLSIAVSRSSSTAFCSEFGCHRSYFAKRKYFDNAKAPIDKFGIVAAMSRNNVIGVDGKIPWKLPEDRTLFKSLTANRIMIIGKRTFKEHPMLAHINHTRACIVVSRTLESIESNPGNAPGTRIVLARSFTEALVTAKDLENELVGASNAPDGVGCPGINCWIAGGERLYKEALLHESAAEVHVSVIDMEIDDNSTGHVARFPFQTLCGNSFEGSTAISYPGHGESPSFTYHIYKKVIPT